MEDVVSSFGPGLTLLMIVVLPFLWSVPMACVASELSSMIPEAGGLYRWIRRALGEYWSFQAGWWWTLSLYIDSAVYVALFTNGDDCLVGGLIGVLSGPIAYLVFKSVYHGTTDEALEGSTITPTGELTDFGAAVEGASA
jgi:Amino acid permease.